MPIFHFHLRAHGRIHRDADGTDLPDLAAAREHALAVAGELMRGSGTGTRHWSMYVEDDADELRLELYFADVDPRLDGLPRQTRMLTSDTCRRFAALTDVLCAAHETRMASRMLLARARGKPALVYAQGE